MNNGLLITFEGIDGSGKSVQIDRLGDFLVSQNRQVILLREPGGTVISESIRDILLDLKHQDMDPMAELLLYEAARAQLVSKKIIPALEAGYIVLCDRFADSTTAYQGYGREFPLDLIEKANQMGTKNLNPDRTYILDITTEESEKRLAKGTNDRMEDQETAFFERVREGYLNIAQNNSDRVRLLDGMLSIEKLEQEIIQDVQLLIKKLVKQDLKIMGNVFK